MKKLSPETIALLHHVELNESGWWKRAISQVVEASLWKAKDPIPEASLHSCLCAELSADLPPDLIGRQVEVLVSQSKVQRLPGGLVKLSEAEGRRLSDAYALAQTELGIAREYFLEQCRQYKPDGPSTLWDSFLQNLQHGVRQAGANTYSLLNSGTLLKDDEWLTTFIKSQPTDDQIWIPDVLRAFFSTDNSAGRAMILRLMTAQFFVEATQLPAAALAALDSNKKSRRIRLVLDTNFVFSLLGLHDNPADISVESLLQLKTKVRPHLEIGFYVLPTTLDEAGRVLRAHMAMLEGLTYSRALSAAASHAPLPSIAQKFFARNAEAGGGISPKDYFGPYLDGLRFVLKERGIDILEWQPYVIRTRQDVVDDINDQLGREQSKPEGRQKSYETIEHDMILWHTIADRRTGSEDSPLDVETWGVTIDWRLINFDQAKRHRTPHRLPLLLYPTNLIQLLQFWIPRSEELDNSVLGSLTMPLFLLPFDPADERVTVDIIKALARYENIDDMGEGTISIVLADKALRGRIRAAEQENRDTLVLVRDALFAEHKKELAAHGETRKQLADATQKGGVLQEQAVELESQLAKARREAETAQAIADENARVARALQEDKRDLEVRNGAAAAELLRLRNLSEHQDFVSRWLVAPPIAVGLFGVATFFVAGVTARTPLGKWAIVSIGTAVAIWAWLEAALWKADQRPALANTVVQHRLIVARRWARFLVFGMLLVPILNGWVYDTYKALTGP